MNTTDISTTVHQHGNADDEEYQRFLSRVQQRFEEQTQDGTRPIFRTETKTNLFNEYLQSFPVQSRQFHNCHACKHFVEHFGSAVVINPNGTQESALWNEVDAPREYKTAIRNMRMTVESAPILSPLYSSEKVWGHPVTGIWQHMAIMVPQKMVYKHPLLSPYQAEAAKVQDFLTVGAALLSYEKPVVDRAVALLEGEALYRSNSVLGPAKFLQNLHEAQGVYRNNTLNTKRSNILWLAVAQAPDGFCHPRSSMIGTLLEDLRINLPIEEVRRRFADKMHPGQYMRPQTAPSAGTVAQAEQAFEKMGLARALRRRFVDLVDIIDMSEWQYVPAPLPRKKNAPGLFAGLAATLASPKPRVQQVNSVPIHITWEKFARIELPKARDMHVLVPYNGNFTGILGPVHADAPPLLQWDSDGLRNPFSWYVWIHGAAAGQFQLRAGIYTRVLSILAKPSHWGPAPMEHMARGAIMVLEGAKETVSPSLGLFPQIIRSELHGVRSVIEKFSQRGQPENMNSRKQLACGLMIEQGKTASVEVKVLDKTGLTTLYKIDRWD